MATIDLSSLTLGNPIVSAKGAKTDPISYQDGTAVTWLPEPQVVAFEPSAFNGEAVARVNLVCKASPDATKQLTELDEAIVALLARDSQKIFGKPLTTAEVRLKYNPCLRVSDKGYDSTFKCKIQIEGSKVVKCWDEDKKLRPLPAEWVGSLVQPKILLKSIWMMSKEVGCLMTCEDLLLVNGAYKECPF